MKLYNLKTLMLGCCAVLLCTTSCKEDDELSLTLTEATSSYDVLNTCDIGGTALATNYDFTLTFAGGSDITIDGVEFDLYWSDGDESPNIFTDNIDVMGNTVEFDWCFRFGTTEWFELDFKLLANGEAIESNSVRVRVDKPAGAN